jgi:hypothetical protein
VKIERVERALRLIYDTQAAEIDCTECFERVSDYVDLEIAGEKAAEKMPALRHHLDLCGVCREEYETLRDLARLEAERRMPSAEDLQRSL